MASDLSGISEEVLLMIYRDQQERSHKMRNWNLLLRAALYAVCAWGASHAAMASPDTTANVRVWTPRLSAAIRYFSTNNIVVSPDGSKFFFQTWRGDPSCDCNVHDLTVYSTEDVKRSLQGAPSTAELKPLNVLTRRPIAHHGPDIYDAEWETNGQAIDFIGLNERGVRQLYRFNVTDGAMTALTDWPNGVGIPLRKGDTIISNIERPLRAPDPTYPMHVITKTEIQAALAYSLAAPIVTLVSYRGKAPWQLQGARVPGPVPTFSSDGRLIVAVCAVVDVPKEWSQYDGMSGEATTDFAVDHFVLIDAEHGTEKAILAAPTGQATRAGQELHVPRPQAFWDRDDQHVVLVNAALPLTDGYAKKRSGMAYILAYNIRNGDWTILEPLQAPNEKGSGVRVVSQVSWLEQGVKLLVQHRVDGASVPATVYSLRGDRWIGETVAPDRTDMQPAAPGQRLLGGLKVELRQSDNDPPVMIASDGRHELALTAPDPVLDGVERASEMPFEWRGSDGRKFTGGLLLPPEAKKHPVPLAIQAYFYSPATFSPDGPWKSPFAAQSLVARGIAVLNVNIPGNDPAVAGTLREFTDFKMEVESAADALASRGTVDRERVGLVGFSRSAFEAYYLITHPGRHPLAAVVLDDGFMGNYMHYLFQGAEAAGFRYLYEYMYGGSFWKRKAAWLEGEGTFNADRDETPALFSIHGQGRLYFTFDTIGAFSLNHRPFEYLMFPQGSHGLDTPLERIASQESCIDWLSFWLQGYEDPNPDKVKQYARWRAIREENEQRKVTESKSPPPKGHWTFVPDPEPQH